MKKSDFISFFHSRIEDLKEDITRRKRKLKNARRRIDAGEKLELNINTMQAEIRFIEGTLDINYKYLGHFQSLMT